MKFDQRNSKIWDLNFLMLKFNSKFDIKILFNRNKIQIF